MVPVWFRRLYHHGEDLRGPEDPEQEGQTPKITAEEAAAPSCIQEPSLTMTVVGKGAEATEKRNLERIEDHSRTSRRFTRSGLHGESKWIQDLDTTITTLLSTRNNMRGVSPGLRKQLGPLEEPWWLLRNSKSRSQSLEGEQKLRLQAVGAPVSREWWFGATLCYQGQGQQASIGRFESAPAFLPLSIVMETLVSSSCWRMKPMSSSSCRAWLLPTL